MKLKYMAIHAMLIACITGSAGCKKLVEVPSPATAIAGSSVFNSDATAIATVTGIYTEMSSLNLTYAGSILSLSLYSGLSADELTLWSGEYALDLEAVAYYQNALSANTGYGSDYWNVIYPYIF